MAVVRAESLHVDGLHCDVRDANDVAGASRQSFSAAGASTFSSTTPALSRSPPSRMRTSRISKNRCARIS